MLRSKKKKTVFVAMSGGVDSSVAAAMIQRQGYRVVGVTMCFDFKDSLAQKSSCCGMEAITEAKRVAQKLNIPHYVLNFAKEIQKDVVDPFISAYLNGRTPNPCVRCNRYVKFGSLLKKARSLGADYLATGHYARLSYHVWSKQIQLKKGKDQKKDQSYFLYDLPQEILSRILFPIGHLTKQQVRLLARSLGLSNAERPGSQDICFIPDGNYPRLIQEHRGPEAFVPGPICASDGTVLGYHKGIAFYTIGQREGLGIAVGKPLYIYRIDPQAHTLFVGDKEKLFSKGLMIRDVNLLGLQFFKKPIEVKIKIRYNHPEAKARLWILDDHKARAEFDHPQMAVTPGQSAVFYRKDAVLGGGIIQQRLTIEE